MLEQNMILLRGEFTEGNRVRVRFKDNAKVLYERTVRYRKKEGLYIVINNTKYYYSDFEISERWKA